MVKASHSTTLRQDTFAYHIPRGRASQEEEDSEFWSETIQHVLHYNIPPWTMVHNILLNLPDLRHMPYTYQCRD